jgi:hypothetical protein
MLPTDNHLDLQRRRPRLASSAKRVAWFLALRRVLQFPAYPMAPLLVRHQPRRIGAFESAPLIDRLGLMSERQPSSSLSRQRHPLATLMGIGNQNSAQNEVANDLTRLAPMSQTRWLSKFSASQHQVALNRAISSAGNPVFPNNPLPFLQANPFEAREGRNDTLTARVYPLGAGTGLSFAFHQVSPANGRYPQPGPWRPPVAGHLSSPLSPGRISGPLEGQTETAQGFHAQAGLAPTVSQQTASEDRNRSISLRSSTLHLDGSALGRWAVDHLQRTLSKPATGMTGVDPRAVIPRSRVSPA